MLLEQETIPKKRKMKFQNEADKVIIMADAWKIR